MQLLYTEEEKKRLEREERVAVQVRAARWHHKTKVSHTESAQQLVRVGRDPDVHQQSAIGPVLCPCKSTKEEEQEKTGILRANKRLFVFRQRSGGLGPARGRRLQSSTTAPRGSKPFVSERSRLVRTVGEVLKLQCRGECNQKGV